MLQQLCSRWRLAAEDGDESTYFSGNKKPVMDTEKTSIAMS